MSNMHPTSPGARIPVIAAGPLAHRLLQALAERFELIVLPKADPALVTDEIAAQVRGMAVLGECSAAFMTALRGLEIVANFGVGYNAVDVGHALKHGVVVTYTPDVLNDEVADTTIGLLIATLRELPRADAFLRQGRWAAGERYPLTRGTLRGRKVGIYGLGRIGRAIAERLVPFNVEVSYHNRRPVSDVQWTWHPTLLELAEAVDTLICVVPGGAVTTHAINAEVLAALGSEGVLVNVGRGSTVDEAALVAALRDGTIMAAGLDVFEGEPHVPHELIELPNTVLLPHVGTASIPTRDIMGDLVADNLSAWFAEGRALTPVPECASRP